MSPIYTKNSLSIGQTPLVLGGVGLVSLLLKLVVEQLLGGVKESRPIN